MENKEQKLLCPYCKNNKFIRMARVEIEIIEETDNNENKTIRDNVITEDYDDYVCSKCDKKVTESELIRE